MNTYLEKHRFCETQIRDSVSKDTGIILVVPCYNEPEPLTTLNSLLNCDKTKCFVEVIVVINSGEHDNENILKQNEKTFAEANDWIKTHEHEKIKFHIVKIKNLPKKHAGVGLARKIGMDEAVTRFDKIKNDNGIVACLDTDCVVDKNYLTEIEKHFNKSPKATGCSIYFEHPLSGKEFKKEIYDGIINYELFLRYYNRALHYCRFPYAFHTIGSSMAVKSNIYQKQGGMNRRKAGEDFYFLHKIFPLGNFTELNSTCVYPSPRESDRVPFGTGSAIKKIIENKSGSYCVYNTQTFTDLKLFFQSVQHLFSSSTHHAITALLPESVKVFLSQNNFEEKLKEIREHSASQGMFVKRFFNWFDGFMVLKFVHFARDNFYAQGEIYETALQLMTLSNKKIARDISKKNLLLAYRKWERESPN